MAGRDHFPVNPADTGKKSVKGALHRWAIGDHDNMIMKTKIVSCSRCNINLCYKCFRYFHTIEDIVAKKEELKATFLEDKKKENKKST
jgi:hypothetical protein